MSAPCSHSCYRTLLCPVSISKALDLVAKVSAYPVQIEAEAAAEAAAKLSPQAQKMFHAALVRLVQSLVSEVESGREALLDSQSAMASLLRRMHAQHDNVVAAHTTVSTMERAVDELATSNTQMRYKLMERPRSGGPSGRNFRTPGGPLDEAEREARTLLPADWELREAPSTSGPDGMPPQIYFVAEPGGTRTRHREVAGLGVVGTNPSRPQSAASAASPPAAASSLSSSLAAPSAASATDRQAVLAFGKDEATRRRHGEWEARRPPPLDPPSYTLPEEGVPRPPHGSPAAGSPTERQPHPSFSSKLSESAAAPTPSPADVARAASAAAQGVSGAGGAASSHSSRPWSERAAQLDALRSSGSEAAAAAAAATAAASALAAGQHKYFVTHSREPTLGQRPALVKPPQHPRPVQLSGVTGDAHRDSHTALRHHAGPAATSASTHEQEHNIAFPAWRLSKKPFARSFSAGPLRRPQSAATLSGTRQARVGGIATPAPFDHRRPASASAGSKAGVRATASGLTVSAGSATKVAKLDASGPAHVLGPCVTSCVIGSAPSSPGPNAWSPTVSPQAPRNRSNRAAVQ